MAQGRRRHVDHGVDTAAGAPIEAEVGGSRNGRFDALELPHRQAGDGAVGLKVEQRRHTGQPAGVTTQVRLDARARRRRALQLVGSRRVLIGRAHPPARTGLGRVWRSGVGIAAPPGSEAPRPRVVDRGARVEVEGRIRPESACLARVGGDCRCLAERRDLTGEEIDWEGNGQRGRGAVALYGEVVNGGSLVQRVSGNDRSPPGR